MPVSRRGMTCGKEGKRSGVCGNRNLGFSRFKVVGLPCLLPDQTGKHRFEAWPCFKPWGCEEIALYRFPQDTLPCPSGSVGRSCSTTESRPNTRNGLALAVSPV